MAVAVDLAPVGTEIVHFVQAVLYSAPRMLCVAVHVQTWPM